MTAPSNPSPRPPRTPLAELVLDVLCIMALFLSFAMCFGVGAAGCDNFLDAWANARPTIKE